MTHYRKAHKAVVGLIKQQIELIIKNNVGALSGHDATITNEAIIEMACEMYENKDAIIAEAGLDK